MNNISDNLNFSRQFLTTRSATRIRDRIIIASGKEMIKRSMYSYHTGIPRIDDVDGYSSMRPDRTLLPGVQPC